MRIALSHLPGNRNRHLLVVSAVLLCASGLLLLYFTLGRGRSFSVVRTEPPVVMTPAAAPKPENRRIADAFRKNQTISDALAEHGMDAQEIFKLVQSARPVYNLARVTADKPYWLTLSPDGEFLEFRYFVDDGRYLTVVRHEDDFIPVMKNFDIRIAPVAGSIEETLIAAITDLGEEEKTALDLAEIFGSDIDFYTDLQKGDSFRLLVEKKYLDGKFIRNGSIVAADFKNQGKLYRGFRFENESGSYSYYQPNGESLRKSFLKSPLKYGRVTSQFSRARYHPILKTVRPHLGVDYGAPEGTPVAAVGEGRVESAGVNGGSGKMVKLRHRGGLETLYLHLSRIRVRPGAKVKQGEVIGYVGSTGLATGPHLDFRIVQKGKYMNPAKMKLLPGPPVSKSAFPSFAALRDSLDSQLRQIVF